MDVFRVIRGSMVRTPPPRPGMCYESARPVATRTAGRFAVEPPDPPGCTRIVEFAIAAPRSHAFLYFLPSENAFPTGLPTPK